jgi:hypothetical protein
MLQVCSRLFAFLHILVCLLFLNCEQVVSLLILPASIKSEKGTKPINISPLFLTGFSDGECSFIVSISKNSEYKLGWAVSPVFKIKLHLRDRPLKINHFFGVGNLSIGTDYVKYSVNSIKDITKPLQGVQGFKVIIPHFMQYPLVTKKEPSGAPARASSLFLSRQIPVLNESIRARPDSISYIANISRYLR